MGIGFTAALFLMGGIRELLGNGSLFDIALPFVGEGHMLKPILIMILPPGGFFVFGILIALSEKLSGRLYRLLPERRSIEPLAQEASASGQIPRCTARRVNPTCAIHSRIGL